MLIREAYACIVTVLVGSTAWSGLLMADVLGLRRLFPAEVRDDDHRVDEEWADPYED
jgi:hypothetical protein